VRDEPLTSSSLVRTGDGAGLVFRPFDHVSFTDHHCTDGSKGLFGIFGDTNDPHGIWEPGEFGEFDQVFELPPEAIGAGRIVQWVKPQSGQVIPVACPGYSQEVGERCSSRLEWAGSLTFEKISEEPDAPAPLVTPQTPPRLDGPATPPPAPKPPFDDPLIAPLVPTKGAGGRRGPHRGVQGGLRRGLHGHGGPHRVLRGPGPGRRGPPAGHAALPRAGRRAADDPPAAAQGGEHAAAAQRPRRAGRDAAPAAGKPRRTTIALRLPRRR
jgi:hypothetical protein